MSTLAKQIEEYLKSLMAQSNKGILELCRSDLAETFMCVPSQINYVLETRFNPSQGYYVESRRGGGGYIRIIKLALSPEGDLNSLVSETGNKSVSQQEGEGLISRLVEEGFLTSREGTLIKSLIGNEVLNKAYQSHYDLRGRLMQKVLLNILREDFEKEE